MNDLESKIRVEDKKERNFMIGYGGLKAVGEKAGTSTGCMKNSFPLETITGLRTKTEKKAFYVDGKALSLRNTLVLKDTQGNDLYKIQKRLLKIRDTMDIKRADGGLAATIKKKPSLRFYGADG